MDKEIKKKFLQQYKEIHPALSTYCRIISGNAEDAKDLLSETILVVLEKWDKIKDKNSFKAFAFGVACNLQKMKTRRMKFSAKFSHEEINHLSDGKNNAEVITEISLIYDKMLELPEKMSQAIILFHIADQSLDTISKIQGCSLSAVKQRLKRGREQLKEAINASATSNLIRSS